ncbi:MAG: glycosyltransferase [Deltaproteobacteria bacterium]|nr:glycosyltransferase [Deltaproteobacteria bacterium]
MLTEAQNKVVIAIPVLLTGGTEIQTLNLVKVLYGAGYGVVVLCYYEYKSEMVGYMEKAGAEVILLKLQREDGLLSLLKKLIVLFKALSPDIVHVQYVAPGLIPIIAARLAGIKKVIATVHQPGRTYGWKARLMLRFGARLCNLFLCVSKSAEESWFGDSAFFDPELFKKGRNHFTIYNAVDSERIAREAGSKNVAQLRSSLNLAGKKVVGYVGRLRWEKGPHILIAAFAKVVQEIPKTVLLVVGDGPDREDLESQAKKIGIETSIIWLCQKSQQDVFQFYGIMDVVAVPSIFEGFGLVAAEAMAAGLPVVGTAVDGLAEIIIDNETGRLVPPQDADTLAVALIMLLASPKTASMMGSKGQQRVEQHFSLQRFSECTLAAYEASQGRR